MANSGRLNVIEVGKLSLYVVIIWLCCIQWTPCNSRPIDTPTPVGATDKSDNASMVVRIIVSSSSSSSTDDMGDMYASTGYARSEKIKETPQIQPEVVFSRVMPSAASARNSRRFNEDVKNAVSAVQATNIPRATTYRPKSQFQLPFFPRVSTFTSTIQPFPFQEDIFSVFYRAFAQTRDREPVYSTYRKPLGAHLEQRNSPEYMTGSRNVEAIRIIPSPSTVQHTRNPYDTSRPFKQQQQSLKTDFLLPNEGKVVTSVVTHSSSSVSSKSPLINRNYSRIRPSSVMMLSLTPGINNKLKNATRDGSSLHDSLQLNSMGPEANQNETASSNKDHSTSVNSQMLEASGADLEAISSIVNASYDWSNKKPVSAAVPRVIPGSCKEVISVDDFPKAEKLIQQTAHANFKDSGGPDTKKSLQNVGQNSDDASLLKDNANWNEAMDGRSESVKNWNGPQWGEPSRSWNEFKQNTNPAAVSAFQEQPKLDVYAANNSGENPEDEDEDPQKGMFFELGEDEDEEPSATIPSELESTVQNQDLPELSPEVDHSFVDASSRSVEVAESVQVSLQRHMDFRPNTTVLHPSRQVPSSSGFAEQSYRRAISQDRDQGVDRDRTTKKFGYVLDGSDVKKYRVEERTADGYIVGEYGVLSNQNGFLRGVRYTADGAINPRLIHEALMKFLSL